MKRIQLGVAIAALLTAGVAIGASHHQPAATVQQITSALADPARADQAGDDARRHAADVIAFLGVGPGATVIDYFPGSGYWSRILTNVVGPKGQIAALWPAWASKYAEKGVPGLQARNLANVSPRLLSDDVLAPAGSVDAILTVQNYHDIPNGDRGEAAIDAFNKAAFAALKPGGVLVVIDHQAPAGSGLASTSTTHRIDSAAVKAQVMRAGFKFDAESKVLANPADDHSKGVFDPSLRGHTDQFIYRFRKPKG